MDNLDLLRQKRLKAPIFYTQKFMSHEQARLEAQSAADANYIKYDADKAREMMNKDED